MSVGLFDADLYQHGPVPFNIDLMKFSAYYKKQRQIVSMSQFFNPDKYTHYVVRKDYNDGNFMDFDFTKPNLEYGGLGFSNGNYFPLDEKIERMPPDLEIYSQLELYYDGNRNKTLFQISNHCSHIRLAPDGKNIDEKCFDYANHPPRQRGIFIHDTNIVNLQGMREIIKERFPTNAIHIHTKFPIITHTTQQFIDWYSWQKWGTINKFQHYGILDDIAIEVITKTPQDRAQYLQYILCGLENQPQDVVDEMLSQILRQAAYLRKHRRKISLRYAENEKLEEPLKRFIELLFIYIKQPAKEDDSNRLLKYIHFLRWKEDKGYSINNFSIKEIRNIMTYMNKNYPQTFNLCYTVDNQIIKGGKLIDG